MHLVHGVQQLPVGGLEAVDLRDGTGYDDRHGVGHIVDFQSLSDGLFQHLGPQAHDVGIIYFFCPLIGDFLFRHWYQSYLTLLSRGYCDWELERFPAACRTGIRLARQRRKKLKI